MSEQEQFPVGSLVQKRPEWALWHGVTGCVAATTHSTPAMVQVQWANGYAWAWERADDLLPVPPSDNHDVGATGLPPRPTTGRLAKYVARLLRSREGTLIGTNGASGGYVQDGLTGRILCRCDDLHDAQDIGGILAEVPALVDEVARLHRAIDLATRRAEDIQRGLEALVADIRDVAGQS